MKSIGIRDLRQRASAVLREVGRGETFEVTDRGRPVAILGPIGNSDPLEQLRAAGEVSTPARRFKGFPPPLPPADGLPLPSEILRRMRDDER